MATPLPSLPAFSAQITPTAAQNPAFQTQYNILNDAQSNADAKTAAKEELKKLGIDIDRMKIARPTTGGWDNRTAHDVKLIITRFGKETQVTNVNEILPNDAAKAAFLFAQQKIYFPVYDQRKSQIYTANIAYDFTEDNGQTKLAFREMTVEKHRAYAYQPKADDLAVTKFFSEKIGMPSKNIGRTETWKSSDIQKLLPPSTAEGTATPTWSHHEQALDSVNLPFLPASESYNTIYGPAIQQTDIRRRDLHDAGTQRVAFPDFDRLAGNYQRTQDLTPSSQTLLERLAQPITAQNADALVDALHKCELGSMKGWDGINLPDLDQNGQPNQAKIDSLTDFLIRFTDYCQLSNAERVHYDTLFERHQAAIEKNNKYLELLPRWNTLNFRDKLENIRQSLSSSSSDSSPTQRDPKEQLAQLKALQAELQPFQNLGLLQQGFNTDKAAYDASVAALPNRGGVLLTRPAALLPLGDALNGFDNAEFTEYMTQLTAAIEEVTRQIASART